MYEFIAAASCDKNITANNPVAAPLLERYKMLMSSANACCTDGMVYSLKQAGATDGLVYKFMADDANFYGFGARCLMMTDDELDTKYPNTATAAVAPTCVMVVCAADVNGLQLCWHHLLTHIKSCQNLQITNSIIRIQTGCSVKLLYP